MFAQMIKTLQQSGWRVSALEENWVSAVYDSQKRGLLFGNLSQLPPDIQPLLSHEPGISQWDVIVFCPEGIDSSDLKNNYFPGIQLWYWDTQRGNLFPFPPAKDSLIPIWLKDLTQGKPIQAEPRKEVGKGSIPFLTYGLIGINLVVFFLMTLAGGSQNREVLIAFGAKVNSLILAGEVWRFFTSMFIHIGYLHLGFNLYALWVLGPFTEKLFGHWRFLVIYLLSGLGGSIASFFFTSGLSAGASGAIFGLLGALLYYSLKRPWLWKSGLGMNLVLVLVINFGFGLTQPGIDNFAHLGGLLTGLLSSILLNHSMNPN
ncbi:putative membrane protein [Desulfosporosinus orientis DSM 765]|uniref:Putative membrane protein n=1 Tax=Desulfosporosinus orientis (strain ATCC 19365 / DSM 765 / NCIMB 8382 / VKM B-1628 / Singapore I) TaxID=768706 RepID=G7WBI9_DESOD|nr:rhomboid family intramembrane serine protease [Desulfosporosinus orientis]AET68747.1 putative membrane protein [Desulfosporosinus orientis DSM 765]